MANIALRTSWRAGEAPRAAAAAWPFLTTRTGWRVTVALPTAAKIYRLIEASCLLGALGLSVGLLAAFLWMGL
jgi:hypothetical protein